MEAVSTVDENLSGKELYNDAAYFMEQQVEKYKIHSTTATKSPSAPDSTKFIATRGGMIEYAPNTQWNGSYGTSMMFQNFVKIGGGVDFKIKQQMEQEFENFLSEYFEGTSCKTNDGYRVVFDKVSGTNWGGYGLSFKK